MAEAEAPPKHTVVDIPAITANARNGSAASLDGVKRASTFGASGMRIIIKDLTFSVPSNTKKGERAILLNAVSGFFQPREMTALMGPSGSGKTTLLDILAGRKTSGKTEGEVLFSGHKGTKNFLRRYTGYVEQFDTLLGTLTVEEMLLYTAELKRSMKEPIAAKKEAVSELLEKLALVSCKDVKIGNQLSKGISGGQAKRTNIGIALITNPRVLFLDEPTSGLDSYTSNEVMTVVRGLIDDGVTIVATIHSPTAYAFSLFDALMMLIRGRVAYFGRQGQPVIDYVNSTTADLHERTPGFNDAEWLVDLFTEADRKGHADVIGDNYANSELCKENYVKVEKYSKDKTEISEQTKAELSVRRATVTPFWFALLTLMKYRTTRNYRDPEWLGPRLGDKIVFGFLVTTLYLGIGDDFNSNNYINIAAVLFMWNTLPAFGAAAYVPAIVLERSLFVRERADGLYRVVTYLIAKMLDEVMIAAASSVVISAIVFYVVKLQGSFALFWLAYYVTLCIGIVTAYFIAALSPNMDVANAALPAYVVTWLFFGGFLIRYESMPAWWKWYSYIVPLRYAWSASMINQFTSETVPDFNGKTVLDFYGLTGLNAWGRLGIEVVFFVVFGFFAWVILSVKRYSSR